MSLIAGTTVAVWFHRRRGTAMGLLSAAGGAGMSLVPVVGTVMISAWGWRRAWFGWGGLVLVLGLPLAVFALRDPRVEEDRRAAREQTERERAELDGATPPLPVTPAVGQESVWTTREILGHPAFWAVLLASAAAGMLTTALFFHQIDLLGAQGLSEGQAAAVFLPQTLTGIVSSLMFGRLSDRIAPRHLLVVALFLLASPTVMWHLVSSGATAVLYGAAVGFGGSGIRTIEGASLPKWYGTTAIGEIRGIVQTTGVAASAVGPVALSLGRDLTGSYGTTLLVLGAIPVALALFATTVHPPERYTAAPVPTG